MKDKAKVRDIDPLRDDPKAVVRDDELSAEQKKVILENWQQDLIELQTASDENMNPARNQSGRLSEQLTRVSKALRAVKGD